MRRVSVFLATLAVTLTFSALAQAQYNESARQNVPKKRAKVEVVHDDGTVGTEIVEYEVDGDQYGNALGNEYDLAVDGAFDGQTIVVLHFYTMEGFDFSLPKEALAEKGFSVYRYINKAPSPEELESALEKACQLWIISGNTQQLNEEHLKVIKSFFDSGRGVYIWGDNDPYYADANYVANYLFDVQMSGNVSGGNDVTIQKEARRAGILPYHLLTTGLEFVFEGITIATIQENVILEPLVYGSEDNLVVAVYDKDGKRAILDGGFTRLYCNWNTAGTGRYVKNAAAWLANYEKFGDTVLGEGYKAERDEE